MTDNLITELPWDSQFFGKRIGRVQINTEFDLARFKDELSSRKMDLIYMNVESKELVQKTNQQIAKKHQLRAVGRRVDFSLKNPPLINSERLKVERVQNNTPADRLHDLAFLAGEYSRYKIDPNFLTSDFIRLYKAWIDNSIKGIIADSVFHVVSGGVKSIGLITTKNSNDYLRIGLIAVDPSTQGKGVGKSLIEKAIQEATNTNLTEIRVATQMENEKACAFYEKMNFKMTSKTFLFHVWINR